MLAPRPEKKWYYFRAIMGGDGSPETSVICKGRVGWEPQPMETLTLAGEWVVYRGERQFQFNTAKLNFPTDPRAQLHYVCERTKGIGSSIEQAIWNVCGEGWKALQRGDVRKLTDAAYNNFMEAIQLFEGDREKAGVLSWLAGMAADTYEAWKNDTAGIVNADCYRLAQLPGYSFKVVDENIRQNFGIADDDPRRIRSAVLYALQTETEDGSTAIDCFRHLSACSKLLPYICDDFIKDAVREMEENGSLRIFRKQGRMCLGKDWSNESSVYGFVRSALDQPEKSIPDDLPFREGLDFLPDQTQTEAVRFAVSRKFAVINGGAGVGGGMESTGSNIKITGGTIEAVGGEGAAGIGGGVYGPGRDIEISGGKVSATGGSYSGAPRPGAAGIGDGAGTEGREIDPDAPPSNPNHIIISGDAEVEAKAGASTGGKTAAIGGGIVGEIPNDALSDDDHKVTGGSLTRYDPDGNKKEDYSYDRRTPSQPEQPDKPDKPEQPDDTENNDDEDDEDDAPDTQAGEVPGRVKQMYEAMGVITHPDGTQELGDVATAEYDPVNKVLSFDAHGTLFRMTGDSLRELAKEVHELRIRFLDGEGREMEAVIPLARIEDLVGMNGAFELELSQEGRYRFHIVGQTGYDRKTFSDETVLRQSGRELILVYRVGDEEQKAQETARVEEAIARRKQEKEQWGTVLSGRKGGSLSGLPGLTQPGTGAVGDLSGLTTLSPESLTTVQQPETSAQQPETGGWVTDSQGDWVWKPGKDDSQPPDLRGNWETRKWMGSSDDYWWEWQPVQEGDQLYWKPILQTRIRDPFYDSAYWKPNKWVRLSDYSPWDFFYDSASSDSAWMYDYEG